MAYKNFVSGVALPEDDLDNYLMRQTVIRCTTGSEPPIGDRTEGMTIYNTTTHKLLQWSGTAWQPPWNQPWGLLAPPISSVSMTTVNSSTIYDLTGFATAAFSSPANRIIRTSWFIGANSDLADNLLEVYITDTANNNLQRTSITMGAATGVDLTTAGFHVESLGSIQTNITRKLRARRPFSNTIYAGGVGGGTWPGFLTVEDIGPVAGTGPV